MVMLLHFEGRNPIIETINGRGIHSDVFYHGSYAGKKEFWPWSDSGLRALWFLWKISGVHDLHVFVLPISKSPSTFRAEFKFFLRLESTVPTPFVSAFVSCLHLYQVFRQDFYIISPCDLLSNLRCKRVNRIAACILYIVPSVPF